MGKHTPEFGRLFIKCDHCKQVVSIAAHKSVFLRFSLVGAGWFCWCFVLFCFSCLLGFSQCKLEFSVCLPSPNTNKISGIGNGTLDAWRSNFSNWAIHNLISLGVLIITISFKHKIQSFFSKGTLQFLRVCLIPLLKRRSPILKATKAETAT